VDAIYRAVVAEFAEALIQAGQPAAGVTRYQRLVALAPEREGNAAGSVVDDRNPAAGPWPRARTAVHDAPSRKAARPAALSEEGLAVKCRSGVAEPRLGPPLPLPGRGAAVTRRA